MLQRRPAQSRHGILDEDQIANRRGIANLEREASRIEHLAYRRQDNSVLAVAQPEVLQGRRMAA